MPSLIHWQVAPKPTGRYRSFFHRGWPTGWSDRAQTNPIAAIRCPDDYVPANARGGRHAPLKVAVALKNTDPAGAAWNWRTLKGEFTTLQAAKDAAETFYKNHRELFYTGEKRNG